MNIPAESDGRLAMAQRVEELVQDEEIRQVTVRMPSDIYDAVKIVARATDQKINGLILHAVADYISGAGREQAVDVFFKEAQEKYHVVLDKLAEM
jgi:predicted transcriptional regulator